ncbi:MAG: phage major capsid protein [Deltaproteobacteria bacterium]|nr:phage major capsid protein [Deltaproteobacteria bacterium]
MALTLLEKAKLSQNPLRIGVVQTFARESAILQDMPFMNTASDSYSYNREQTLGRADFRSINAEYTEETGTLDKVTENLTVLGGYSDVDRVLIATSGDSVNDIRSVYDGMKAKAVALKFTKTAIKGDCESSPKEFDGLQVRCTGDQLIAAGSSSGGDALSLAKLDEAIDAVDGDVDAILMNATMGRRMSAAARLSSVAGNVNYDVDEFGKRVVRYNGIKLALIRRDENDDEIMPFSETGSGGGTAQCTSIYIVRYGLNTAMCGLECGPVAVEDMGYQNNVCARTLIEWIVGLTLFNKRSACRLYGITDAAIAA